MTLDNSFKKHHVFEDLGRYIEIYKDLSFSVFGFITIGTKAACNIDSYVFSSMQGTLDSIKNILSNGRINDSYALLRKYYDSVIINIYANLYLKNNFNMAAMVVSHIDNWLRGKEPLPEYRIMSDYIRSSPQLKKINDLLYEGSTTYKDLRSRCNDHMHYNHYHNLLLNDGEIYLQKRMAALEGFSEDLDNVFILHLSYLFYLNDHYMMSSDYMDHMECEMTPPKDSEYFVAPFVQNIFDSVIKKKRLDIAAEIKNATKMHLE